MGPRTPVVMVHGAFCGAWVFKGWRALFEASGFAVHTPLLRHHEPDADLAKLGRTGLADYTNDLCALIEQIGDSPIVVGHSLGGLIAQMLAERARVRALVLLAPSPPWGMFCSTGLEFMSAQALYFEGAFWRKAIAPQRQIAAKTALEFVPDAERARVLDQLVPESGQAMFEVLHWMLDLHRASHVNARAIAGPILCLAGAQDRINPPETVRRIARRYDGRARYEKLSGHGHWLTGEPGWEKIAGGAVEWLLRVLGRDPESVGR